MPCKYKGEEYSEGAEICQAGRVRKCSGTEWVDTGRDCFTIRPEEIPGSTLSESDLREHEEVSRASLATGNMYALRGSIRRVKPWVTYDGAKKVSLVCHRQVNKYKALLEDVEIYDMGPCEDNMGIAYCLIEFKK